MGNNRVRALLYQSPILSAAEPAAWQPPALDLAPQPPEQLRPMPRLVAHHGAGAGHGRGRAGIHAVLFFGCLKVETGLGDSCVYGMPRSSFSSPGRGLAPGIWAEIVA
jgi:hypothetical protein